MPKIVIKGKGLAKAQFMNSQINRPPSSINFQQSIPSLGSGVNQLDNGFSPFPLTTNTTQPAYNNVQADLNIPNCGEGSTWDPIEKKCKPKQGYTQLNDPITGKSSFIKDKIQYTPQNEALQQGWGKEKEQKPSFLDKVGAWGNRTQQNLGKFYGALDDVNSLLGQIDADRKFKRGQEAMRQNLIPDNTYAVGQQSAPNTKGDYNINSGVLGKQGSYTVNKGQAINNTNFLPERVFYNQARDGGENTGMKIRITRTPDQDIMAYGGQARHSLDLRRDALLTPNIKYEDDYEVNETLKPVPREDANIEAEKDETAFGDFDGDGNFEHMKIGGKRHHEGGTPLNLPEGTFIFSDTAKMRIKDEEVLSYFSLKPKKGGYTPAEIAKRYDVNRYKSIIENPEADDISKSTAEQMVKNYNKKLAYLALIQESMKGFPQGIPEVCKKILGIQDNTEEQQMQASPEDEEAMMQQSQQGVEEEMPEQGMARYGTSIKQLAKYQGTGPSEVVSDPNYEIKATSPGYLDYSTQNYAGDMWSKNRYDKDWVPLVKKSIADPATYERIKNRLSTYSGPDKADVIATYNKAMKSSNPAARLERLATDRMVGPFHAAFRDALKPDTTTSTTTQPPLTTSTTTQPETTPYIPPGTIGDTTPTKPVNKGPLWPDVQAMFAATAYAPKNYQIAVKSPPPTNQSIFLKDPRQALAENQSLFNAAAANIGAMGDVRTTNAAMSNLQGEALKGAAGIVGNVQDQNVDIFNAWSAQNRAAQDQYNKEAADLATQRGFVARDTDVFNRNQGRMFERGRAAVKANMWNNMMKNNLLNSVNTNYSIDPWTGEVAFKEGYDPNNLRARGSQYNYPSPEHFKELQAKFPTLTEKDYFSPGLASTFKQQQQTADPYAAYYNFYNPMTAGS